MMKFTLAFALIAFLFAVSAPALAWKDGVSVKLQEASEEAVQAILVAQVDHGQEASSLFRADQN